MRIVSVKPALAIIACLLAACGAREDTLDLDAYTAEIMQWRAQRIERLKSPDGYLDLVGLYWLESDTSHIGSGPDNDIVFPAPAAAHIGELELTDDGVVLHVAEGVDVRYEGQPVSDILMQDDNTEAPVTVSQGSLAWTIIKRDSKYAVRLRDYDHPALKSVPPIESYPIDPAMRVTGVLKPFAEPRVLNVDTTIVGLGYHPVSPGTIEFRLDGVPYELEAYEAGDSLFFVFGDQTSGRETYPAGRFLYAELPDEDGKTIIDFNYAYTPPCAFNAFATCPVASPRNRLKTRIEAGERFDPRVHKVPG